MSVPSAIYLKDYQAPHFTINTTELFITLDDTDTLVRSVLTVVRQGEHVLPLILDSEVEDILEIKVDGVAVPYQLNGSELSIETDANQFQLEIENRINPSENLALEGLYKSNGAFCTQCEAHGFRRITPYLDRPDVLSVFTVHLFADPALYPFVLSNGNLVDDKLIDEGEQQVRAVTWHDPHPKPSYLFAIVAGQFDCLVDTFVTVSGREVQLELFVEPGNKSLAQHAMDSLIKSMRWDEQKYGLEYDLDVYMIVAVDFFNMGAMENKGLNVFNSKYVLADQSTATDDDYHGIESVIAHEYFHNWTGNRVTCRDWFQLSLKEGLTVFRDQQFSADMGSAVIERIKHATVMRTHQFSEDAGPMAHPIRPEKVIEMNNFYTVTVYDKGAEVIRMLHAILGEQGFRAGMDLYFKRHDGQAVTCDDFVAAMADANQVDLTQFKNWYQQAGTPVVTVNESFENGQLLVSLSQRIPTQEHAKTLVIPVKYELFHRQSGKQLAQGTWLLEQASQTFSLDAPDDAVLVLFENFSAPVKVNRTLGNRDLLAIIEHATDYFSRWDAAQSIWTQLVHADELDQDLLSSFATTLSSVLIDGRLELAIKAELLAVPNFATLAEAVDSIDVDKILSRQRHIAETLVKHLHADLLTQLNALPAVSSHYESQAVAKRRLQQVILTLLSYTDQSSSRQAIAQVYENAVNMTETMMAANAMVKLDADQLEQWLDKLVAAHPSSTLVLDKALSLIARLPTESVFEKMTAWATREGFSLKNPNRVRALYGQFVANNPHQFHASTGQGYHLLKNLLLEIDKFNPQLAARMIVPLLSWRRFDSGRAKLMQDVLKALQESKLSNDLFEKVQAALEG